MGKTYAKLNPKLAKSVETEINQYNETKFDADIKDLNAKTTDAYIYCYKMVKGVNDKITEFKNYKDTDVFKQFTARFDVMQKYLKDQKEDSEQILITLKGTHSRYRELLSRENKIIQQDAPLLKKPQTENLKKLNDSLKILVKVREDITKVIEDTKKFLQYIRKLFQTIYSQIAYKIYWGKDGLLGVIDSFREWKNLSNKMNSLLVQFAKEKSDAEAYALWSKYEKLAPQVDAEFKLYSEEISKFDQEIEKKVEPQ